MESSRPLRRPRRACEPCRRKKVKCPGEQPICSYCRRLGQTCDYRSSAWDHVYSAENPMLERRIEAIEGKLDSLIGSLGHPHTSLGSANGPIPPATFMPPSPSVVSASARVQTQPESSGARPKDQELLNAGQLYQTWCHNQPLYLFRQDGFLESLEHRDTELQLAIQALSHLFPPGALTSEKRQALNAGTESCRKLVTHRVTTGNVKLSTLQALCLLSLIGFGDGNPMQAGLDLGTARYFMGCLPLGSSLGDPLECSLCTQSISLLQNLHECVSEGATTAKLGMLFRNADSLPDPFRCQCTKLPLLRELGREEDTDLGILHYVDQAAKTWQMSRAYAAAHVGADEPPPWNPQSDYSLIMLRNLEVDSTFPLKYRFVSNNFGHLSPQVLERQRGYWAPWLFVQFIHATIPALVNHPFLLSMRLKNFRRMMPQTFIHQSFDHISRNTTWVICFLDLIEKQQFTVSDPTIAHCVAIVATIHLQHSFVQDSGLREKAKVGYGKCMRFLDRMGSIWASVSSMARNLRKLHDSITTVPSPTVQATQSHTSNMSRSVDAQLLWDILIYEKSGRRDASADRSMFSDVIVLAAEHREHDVNEFAMVGSAGISGHKTVPTEISAYAPEDNERRPEPDEPTTPIRGTAEGGVLSPGQFIEGLGDGDQMMGQENVFLQAEDFGRAINDWFSFDFN